MPMLQSRCYCCGAEHGPLEYYDCSCCKPADSMCDPCASSGRCNGHECHRP